MLIHNVTYLDKLIKINNKILRILLEIPLCTSVSHLYEKFDLLPTCNWTKCLCFKCFCWFLSVYITVIRYLQYILIYL